MRELNAREIFHVPGAGLTFTTPVTMTVLNDVAQASTIAGLLSGSFGFGYSVGTWLNNKFDLSTRIVDFISAK